MFTSAAIASWLASKGASLLLGFLAGVIKDAWADYQNRKALEQVGQLQSQNAGLQKANTELVAAATARADADNNQAAHPADDDGFDPDFKRETP